MSILQRLTAVVALIAALASCHADQSGGTQTLALPDATRSGYELSITQYLTNDAPLGPGEPQPSDHCPNAPGTWIAGSGRSTAVSNVFGDLTEVEVYCINADRGELSGGIATWTDAAGDTISMSFGATLLRGFAYAPTPNAPIIGFARFTGGTGKWSGIAGDALITGRQNGDGTAELNYKGMVYLPD